MLVDKELRKDLRTPTDTNQVTLDEEWEVRYWCERFEVDEQTLRACVTEVGPRVQDVDQRLRASAKQAFKNNGED